MLRNTNRLKGGWRSIVERIGSYRLYHESHARPRRLSALFLPSGGINNEGHESTQELLERAGYLRQASAGIFQLLPLGVETQRRIESIIRYRLEEIGSSEVELSSLSESTLWKQTGRWDTPELYKLKDSNGKEFCLAPTFEEDITNLVSRNLKSPKTLPIKVYSIGKKYRDELRPRGGLLRGKEFTMKDLYSFDRTSKEAYKTYQQVVDAYRKIFNDIGVEFLVARADSGSIGGDLSHEFHFPSKVGEDTIVECINCKTVTNIELADSIPIQQQNSAKLVVGASKDRARIYLLYLPNDERQVSSTLIKQVAGDWDPQFTLSTSINELLKSGKEIIPIVDSRLVGFDIESWNRQEQQPQIESVGGGGVAPIVDVPLVQVSAGEVCKVCKEELKLSKAIEVGHTFYLGTKYSSILNGGFIDDNNNKKYLEMGCYGIGISRLIAAIAEKTRDKDGLCWPINVAPFQVIILSKSDTNDIAQEYIKLFELNGIRVIHDDRNYKNMGWKLKDCDLIGIPISIILGNKFLNDGLIEIKIRINGKRFQVDKDSLLQVVNREINSLQKHDKNFSSS